MKFRRKKDDCTIVIHKKHWKKPFRNRGKEKGKGKKDTLYGFLRSIKSYEYLPNHLLFDSRIQYIYKTGEYYLVQIIADNENQIILRDSEEPKGIVSLDPGVRTFQTCYNPKGEITEWGKGDMKEIIRLLHTWDSLNSQSTKVSHRKKYSLRKAMRRIRKRIGNLIDDIHRKCAKWLLENHSVILIPVFRTSEMQRAKNLSKTTKRALGQWSHFRFRMRLMGKAQKYPGTKIFVVGEEYTSRTCTYCGNLVEKRKDKILGCGECGYRIDRDIQGSRNILLKFLTEQISIHNELESALRPGSSILV